MKTKADQSLDSQSAPEGRRPFLGVLLGFMSTIGALFAIPLVRFALHPVLGKSVESAWSDLGAVDEFAAVTAPVKRIARIEQLDGWRRIISEKPVYVIKGSDGQLRTLSTVCPHLGCSITWKEERQQFGCPCHMGVFAADGALVSGPPPRSMDTLEHRVENGRIQVRYQYFRQLAPTKELIT